MRKTMDNLLKVLAGLTLAIMFLLVIWQVFTRYVLNNPSTWSEELVAYLFAWTTLFGASLVVSEKGHMNIPILFDKVSDNKKKGLTIFSEIMILAFSLVVLTIGGILITKLALNQKTSSLSVPIGVFYIPLPITGIINTIYAILNIKDIKNGNSSFVNSEDMYENLESNILKGESK